MTYTIFSKPNCPQCDQAKILLTSRSLEYDEIIIDIGQTIIEGKKYMNAADLKKILPNAKSVPQIFNNGVYIGGLVELRNTI